MQLSSKDNKILAACKSEFGLCWQEFPGGKSEAGEDRQKALTSEFRNCTVACRGAFQSTVTYSYHL